MGNTGSLLSRKEESLYSLYRGRETLFYIEKSSLFSLYREESLFSLEKRSVSILSNGNTGSLLSRKEESLYSLYRG